MATKTAKLTADLTANTTSFEAGFKRASNTFNTFGKNAERASRRSSSSFMAVSAAVGALSPAFAALAAVLSVGQIIKISDQMTNLTSRIKQSTNGVEEFSRAFKGLTRISLETGGSLAASVDVFQRLSFVREEIGATIDEMLVFTETVQKIGVAGGSSTQALQAGLLQLGQGLSAGVLRAEEFNSLTENIPAVANAIAKEFGVTVGQLGLLVKDGKVLSKDVFQALLNQSADVNKKFAEMPVTVERATAKLKTQFDLLVQTTTGLVGTQELFVFGLDLARDIIKDIDDTLKAIKGAFSDLGDAVQDEFSGPIAQVQEMLNNIRVAIALIESVSGVSLGGGNRDKKTDSGVPTVEVTPIETDYKKIIEELEKKLKDKGGSTKDASDFIRDLQNESKELEIQTSLYGQKQSAIDRATRQLRLSNQITQAGIVLTKEQQKQVDAYLDKIEQQTELQKQQASQQKELEDRERSRKQALDNLAASFEGAFEDAIVSGKKLSDVLGGLAQDILRLTIRRAFVTPIVNSVFGDGGFGGQLASVFGGSYATGIDYVPRDMMAMVHKGESIIPRQQAEGMRGGDVSINIINNNNSKVSTSQNETSGGMDLNVMIDKAVADNITRPGSRTSQALGAVKNRTLIGR